MLDSLETSSGPGSRTPDRIWLVAGVLGLFALALLLPNLGDDGFWSAAEVPVLDRARAALGAAISGLERSPWLPDFVRTRSHAVLGGELGLRLPHALAGAGLTAIAAGLARWRGASLALSGLGGLFVLALPAVAVASRTALGNPIGELMSALTVVLGLVASRSHRVIVSATAAIFASATLVASIASAGLALGGIIPLLALALADHGARTRKLVPVLWLLVAIALAITVRLALQQEDGYIPLLGAAKDLELIDKPEGRRFADILQAYGYQVAPWAALAAVGAALGPRARWPALWAIAALTVSGGWSLVYGDVHVPAAVPTALCCVAAVEAMLDATRPVHARRLMVLVALGGILVTRKDAERTPSRIAVPVWSFQGEHRFPDDDVQAAERLRRIGGVALLGLLGAAMLARRRDDEPHGRIESALRRIPERWRDHAALGLVSVAVLHAAIVHTRALVPALGRALSPAHVLAQYEAWVEAGALPSQLAVHRVRDPGLALYGPTDIQVLESRRKIIDHLAADEPRVALVRDLDVPTVVQHHRAKGLPLFVLDDGHDRYRLVSNVLPEGAEDRNPISAVLLDEPPVLAHETLVRFENYVEVVGWEVEQPLVRGQKRTLRLALEVLRPLPGGSKIYARFLRGRLSRINSDAHEVAGDVYPPNLWRAGDYILHELEFDVPVLEILPGTYEFVVGFRRSEKKNYDVSLPEGPTGAFDVVVKDSKRNFATIGEVEVW